MRLAFKILAAVILALLAYIAIGGAMVAVAGALPMRGEMIDIGGGRRMHIICDGPKSAAPTILFEAGAFGFSADWGALQPKVAAQGLHACAYDRAGLSENAPQATHQTLVGLAYSDAVLRGIDHVRDAGAKSAP